MMLFHTKSHICFCWMVFPTCNGVEGCAPLCSSQQKLQLSIFENRDLPSQLQGTMYHGLLPSSTTLPGPGSADQHVAINSQAPNSPSPKSRESQHESCHLTCEGLAVNSSQAFGPGTFPTSMIRQGVLKRSVCMHVCVCVCVGGRVGVGACLVNLCYCSITHSSVSPLGSHVPVIDMLPAALGRLPALPLQVSLRGLEQDSPPTLTSPS